MYDLAKLGEVDEPIPGNLVGQVQHLLLQGVQAEHLEGSSQVLKIGQISEIKDTSLSSLTVSTITVILYSIITSWDKVQVNNIVIVR